MSWMVGVRVHTAIMETLIPYYSPALAPTYFLSLSGH